MTGLHRPSLFTGFFIAITASLAIIAGCEPTCDSVPTQSLAHLRIVNAVPDVPLLNIVFDHDTSKLFDKAYYEMDRYTSRHFNYQSKFLTGGGSLASGSHAITATDSLGNVIFDTTLILSNKDETLVIAGLHHGSEAQRVVGRLLNDELRSSDKSRSLLRFVQAVPDIPGIDLFFYQTAPTLPPNIRIQFPQITDKAGSGNGTGFSADDYVTVTNADTTLITVTGDLTAAGEIVKIPYYLSSHGLFGTVIIRGRGAATDGQPTTSVLFIPDGPEFSGGWQINYQFYEVRLVNATRIDSLYLLAHDAIKEIDKGPRNNIPQQPVVFHITPDAVSQYWRLTTTFHPNATFSVATKQSPSSDADYIDSIKGSYFNNERLTLIEMRTPAGSQTGYSILRLEDTLSLPGNVGMARVRFVNASPDHPQVTVSAGSTTIASLTGEGSVTTKDIPISTTSLTVSDGTNTATVPITLANDTPITVIFTVATATKPFPYTIAIK